MLERVRTAIVAPQNLIKFRNDRVIFVLLFMLFFALLMTTGPVLRTLRIDSLTHDQRRTVENETVFPETDCAISDAVLSCEEESVHVLLDQIILGIPFQIVLDGSGEYKTGDYDHNSIVIHEDTVYLAMHQLGFGQTIFEKPVSALHGDVHNLDFNPETAEERAVFFDAFVHAIDQEINTYKGFAAVVIFVVEFISALVLFGIFVLLNSFLIQRRFRKVPFKQMFVMMTYASTLAFVVLIFYNMMTFNLILFLVLLFVAFRQTSKLAFEIQNRLYS